MDKIVVSLRPFILKQQVLIYKDKTITIQSYDLPELADECYKLCKQNDIHHLVLYGQHFIADKIKQKLNTTKYQNFDINIQIIYE